VNSALHRAPLVLKMEIRNGRGKDHRF